jgi:hypothetical protein
LAVLHRLNLLAGEPWDEASNDDLHGLGRFELPPT